MHVSIFKMGVKTANDNVNALVSDGLQCFACFDVIFITLHCCHAFSVRYEYTACTVYTLSYFFKLCSHITVCIDLLLALSFSQMFVSEVQLDPF